MSSWVKHFIPLVLFSTLPVANVFAQDCLSLDGLEKLIGHWQENKEGQITQEEWQRVSPNSFEGEGVILGQLGIKQSIETLRLVEMSGDIFYIAKVKGNSFPISFKLTSCSDTHFVFENPEHDFPQKISYNFLGVNRMVVNVTGKNVEGFEVELIRTNHKE